MLRKINTTKLVIFLFIFAQFIYYTYLLAFAPKASWLSEFFGGHANVLPVPPSRKFWANN